MRYSVRCLVVLLAAAVALPGWAQEPKKDAKDKTEEKKKDPEPKKDAKEPKKDAKEKPEPKEKLIPVLTVAGKLERKPGAQPVLVIGLYAGTKKIKDEEVTVTDDTIVRRLQLPANFDEKGRPKALSKKERDELRGSNKKLPGYTATMDHLKVGQVIEIHLVRKSTDPKNIKPHVGMIVILIDTE